MEIDENKSISYFTVGINQCDPYKILHNSQYFALFEEALLCKLFTKELLDNSKEKPFEIIESRCRYIYAAKYKDELIVDTKVYGELKEENIIHTRQTMTNKSTGKVISICKSSIRVGLERM